MLLVVLLLMALTADTRIASAAPGGAGPGVAPPPVAGDTPFDRQGMWIWYVDRSDGGSAPRILTRAKAAGIGTLYVKAGDGGSVWSQFNKSLVGALHEGGLDVCAWQFVYGDSPVDEAKVGAAAVRRGADCLVVDAEGQYEGKYAAADRYIRALRARIGGGFPLSLAGFPYVDYHPSFPYSVFFGAQGATVDQPQMYWKAMGTSVRAVFEHTYVFNRLWGRPVYPLGQTYGGAGRTDIVRFRRFSASYGGLAPSWWDWQETSSSGWSALGSSIAGPVAGYRPVDSQPLLRRGSRGDLVVWPQEHLQAAVQPQLPVTGIFGKQTRAAVRSFQASEGLPVDGALGTDTWSSLLTFDPVRPRWAGRRAKRGGGAMASRALPPRRPLSVSLPAKAYEIDPGPAP
ncbi:MAG TPA: peptidoglycan-binding domain-containing protein [Solirubrobacterales bacterium]|nr:peptidoglycan-binding domain-containing protein [Solirubrobacterales bacterium]